MKILALDLGQQWVGTALSDALGILAKPYKTIPFDQLEQGLSAIFSQEKITEVVIGYPKTLKGTESQQTQEIVKVKEQLQEKYPDAVDFDSEELLYAVDKIVGHQQACPRFSISSVAIGLVMSSSFLRQSTGSMLNVRT